LFARSRSPQRYDEHDGCDIKPLVLILITLVAGTVNGALGYGFSSITFRRVCMSFDTWVVGFGISTLLRQLHVIETQAAFFVLAAVGLLDTWLLYRFFHAKTPEAAPHARRSSAIPMRLSPADAEPAPATVGLAAAASSSSPIPPVARRFWTTSRRASRDLIPSEAGHVVASLRARRCTAFAVTAVTAAVSTSPVRIRMTRWSGWTKIFRHPPDRCVRT